MSLDTAKHILQGELSVSALDGIDTPAAKLLDGGFVEVLELGEDEPHGGLFDGLLEQEPCHAILEHPETAFDGRGDGGGEERVLLMGGQMADVEKEQRHEGETPIQREYRKAYNRLKTRRARGKISADERNRVVAEAQELRDRTVRGEVPEVEAVRLLAGMEEETMTNCGNLIMQTNRHLYAVLQACHGEPEQSGRRLLNPRVCPATRLL